MKGARAVVFDLGNVVLNWDVEGILGSLTFSQAEINSLRHDLFLHQNWLDLDHGIVTEADVTTDLSRRTNLSAGTIEAALLAAKKSLTIIDETIALMEEVSRNNIRMYCLSNMSRETYEHIQDYDFFDLFDGILISGHERCMKPDPKIFHMLLDRFELNPGSTLFIDDSKDNIEAATRQGIRGFHFQGEDLCYTHIREQLFNADYPVER